ncbi:YcnI family protein [Castellaniella caeni]
MKASFALGALTAALLSMPAAQAHVTLQTRQAPVGSYYKAVLRVPHGCQGSDTTALRVRIPEGVLGVKPQLKPGWTIDIVQGPYEHTQEFHGATLDHGVRELVWKGGRLPDAYYDEFAFFVFLSPTLSAGQPLYFPVVQTCEKGVERWIDTSGKPDAAGPAPHLELTRPAAPAGHAR